MHSGIGISRSVTILFFILGLGFQAKAQTTTVSLAQRIQFTKYLALQMSMSADFEDFAHRIYVEPEKTSELVEFFKKHKSLKLKLPQVDVAGAVLSLRGKDKVQLHFEQQPVLVFGSKKMVLQSQSLENTHKDILAFLSKPKKTASRGNVFIDEAHAVVPFAVVGAAIWAVGLTPGVLIYYYGLIKPVGNCTANDANSSCVWRSKQSELQRFFNSTSQLANFTCANDGKVDMSELRVNSAAETNLIRYQYSYKANADQVEKIVKTINGKPICTYMVDEELNVRHYAGECNTTLGTSVDLTSQFPHSGFIECCQSEPCVTAMYEFAQKLKSTDDRNLPLAPQAQPTGI